MTPRTEQLLRDFEWQRARWAATRTDEALNALTAARQAIADAIEKGRNEPVDLSVIRARWCKAGKTDQNYRHYVLALDVIQGEINAKCAMDDPARRIGGKMLDGLVRGMGEKVDADAVASIDYEVTKADFEKQVDRLILMACKNESSKIVFSGGTQRDRDELDHARRNLLAVLCAQRDLIQALEPKAGKP